MNIVVLYLIVAAVVLGVNLLPAFGPPTWAILVFYRLNMHLPVVGLVLVRIRWDTAIGHGEAARQRAVA